MSGAKANRPALNRFMLDARAQGAPPALWIVDQLTDGEWGE
jgi:hypothetical protein